jgi:phage shock protein C
MSLTDEITHLDELHRRGALTDEEFSLAKARLIAGAQPPAADNMGAAINSLRRSRSDRWIGGVCGGLAQASGLESWAWRLAFAFFLLFGGAGALIYGLLWIFVPAE